MYSWKSWFQWEYSLYRRALINCTGIGTMSVSIARWHSFIRNSECFLKFRANLSNVLWILFITTSIYYLARVEFDFFCHLSKLNCMELINAYTHPYLNRTKRFDIGCCFIIRLYVKKEGRQMLRAKLN